MYFIEFLCYTVVTIHVFVKFEIGVTFEDISLHFSTMLLLFRTIA